ncbi:MAG: MotA/TolQ/ExbB proton channel family protein [bacterium]
MFGGIQILKLFNESIAMWFLLIASVVGIMFVIERLLFYIKWKLKKKKIGPWLNGIKSRILEGETKEILEECREQKHPVASLIATALENSKLPSEDLNKVLIAWIAKIQIALESNLGILGTISSIAPLLGLFGTVDGIIRSFRAMAVASSGGSTVVAMGVAVALVTTAIGILIAVPALIAYNYSVRIVAVEVTWLETVKDEVATWIKQSKR